MHPVYSSLSRIKFLSKRYTLKFLFIAFLGIHVPLIGLILFILFRPDELNQSTVILLTLFLTLGATAVTLFILNGLLSPLRMSRQALNNYLTRRELPELPTQYADEAGLLMKNIHFALNELNDLLEEKKDLTALLSHDLRIPIRNVQTFAGFLKQQSGDEAAVKEIADVIRESAEEQQVLLNEVLEILRQDYLFTQTAERAAIEPLIEESLQTILPSAEAKNISFITDIQHNATIEVQPELFKQVLKNLLSNAVKFSYPDTQVTISVFLEKGRTAIRVTDAGMGFDQTVSERLFDRFTKVGRKGTAGEASTGIGLYLSRKIVQHQQGELTAVSAGADRGSSFTISLP